MYDLDFKKVDLHLHLDGSLNVNTMFELAKQKNLVDKKMPWDEFEKLCRVSDECKSLNDFLARFELPIKLMQDKVSLTRFAYDLVKDLARQNLCYAEVRFAPQYHCSMGLSQYEVVDAVLEGINNGCEVHQGIKIGLILCMTIAVSYDNEKENRETIHVCKEFLGRGVVALDLAGAEGMHPMEDYRELFQMAREQKIPYTIHAGESGTYENVMKALELGCKRIGHGQSAMDHPATVSALIEHDVPLELCVTSNIQCQVRPSFEQHPIQKLYEAGVKLTINTDNMTISNTSLLEEYKKLIKYYGFTRKELIEFNLNSIKYSFMDEQLKLYYVDLIKNS